MLEYYALGFLSVIFTAVSQTMLKVGSQRGAAHPLLRSFLNGWTMAAYGLFILVTLNNLYVFTVLPLKAMVVLVPFQFILVGAFSMLVLKERFSRQQLLGSLIIIGGVVVFLG